MPCSLRRSRLASGSSSSSSHEQADDGVRDHHPLLLAAGQFPDPGVGVGLGADRAERLVNKVRRGKEAAEAPATHRHCEADQVGEGAQRHVGVDGQLLRT